jgi:HAD superfamily hydrolase (TIGR01509 family)
MNIIIPLCGIGKRFTDAGFTKPKPLIDIFDKTLIIKVIECLKLDSEDKIFIIYHESLNEFNFCDIILTKHPFIELVPIKKRTLGAAETVLFGIEYILEKKDYNKNCLIIDCDTIYNTNILKKIRKVKNNAVIYFEDIENKPIYSYITISNNMILDIKEKQKISNNANTGAYYFIDIIELQKYCKYIINNNITFKNEFYISCVIKQMLIDSNAFEAIKINRQHYISLGTPDELYKYTDNHLNFLFDLDGTLVKTDLIYYNIWKEILEKYNIILTDKIFESFIQGNNDKFVMESLQIDTNSYNIDEISELKDSLFLKYISNIVLFPGVYKFIKNIKKNGHSTCLVTNCNRKICESILKYMNILDLFDYIVIGNECNKPKPYPDPYLKAITLLCTTSNKCIIFEDSKPGILSALGISPRNIIGVNNGSNMHVLEELLIKNIISGYEDINYDSIINNTNNKLEYLEKMILQTLNKRFNIKTLELNTNKLKGGYISDVIQAKIILSSDETLNLILKYENDYTSSLSKMAYKLGLFDREYYFYESISNYININIPKFYGIIRDIDFNSKGILLENINNTDFKLALDLNKESIDTSLKVIEQCAKLHSQFWNKDLQKSFINLKKHNDTIFKPVWGDFLKEKLPIFLEKWKHIIKPNIIPKLDKIISNFGILQDRLSINNLTLCHGDVKSGNIFYKKMDEGYMPYFIDWQYIVHGKGVQDIVFFLIESFNLENIKQYSNIFKEYYYFKLKEYGVKNYSLEDYNKDFSDAICYFPLFVAIWFGTTPNDELIDISFPFLFIQKFLYFFDKVDCNL